MMYGKELTEEHKAALEKWEKLSSEEKGKARDEIVSRTRKAMELIREAEKISDESGLSFSFDIAYAMGGTYSPETKFEEDDYQSFNGWCPSSVGC
jgi:hypothetical protein